MNVSLMTIKCRICGREEIRVPGSIYCHWCVRNPSLAWVQAENARLRAALEKIAGSPGPTDAAGAVYCNACTRVIGHAYCAGHSDDCPVAIAEKALKRE